MSITRRESSPAGASWDTERKAASRHAWDFGAALSGKQVERDHGHLWRGHLSGSPHSGLDGPEVMTGNVGRGTEGMS